MDGLMNVVNGLVIWFVNIELNEIIPRKIPPLLVYHGFVNWLDGLSAWILVGI